jgi:hypothetical protein
MDRERPVTTEDEIDRTGRDEQVTGRDIHPDSPPPEPNAGFGTEGKAADAVVENHDNDFA